MYSFLQKKILAAFLLIIDNELLSIYRLIIGDGINKSSTQLETNEVCSQRNTVGRLSFKVIFPLASCSVVKKSSPMKNMRARSCRKRKYSLGNDIVSNWRRPICCISSDFR